MAMNTEQATAIAHNLINGAPGSVLFGICLGALMIVGGVIVLTSSFLELLTFILASLK